VVPSTYSAFFAASAGVAGALIGLLFVAISIAPAAGAGQQRLELDVRAGVAFSALTDTLVVALFALIPGVSLDRPAMAVAAAGFASCVALELAGQPNQQSAVRSLAILSVIFFVIGIARAWELIGARDTGLVHAVREAIHDRTEPSKSSQPD
jgi:hypothetical protein